MPDDRRRRARVIGGIAAAVLVVGAAIIVPAVASDSHDGPSASSTDEPGSGSSSQRSAAPEATGTPNGMPIKPTLTPKATSTASPSGQAMPTGDVTADGVTWQPVLSQDFSTDAETGSVLSDYPDMSAYSGIADTSGKGMYEPSKVLSVHDSELDFHLRTVDGQPLVSSVLPAGYTGYEHMRVSIRYRADSIPGYKFVMILWPLVGQTVAEQWNNGEIDWPEGDLDGDVRPASAIPGSYDAQTDNMSFLPATEAIVPGGQSAWHTATVDWTADNVTFSLDGKQIAQVGPQAVPKVKMRVTLQAETTVDSTPVPASADGHVDVDWVVAYKEAG